MLNDESKRKTHAIVYFGDKHRFIGITRDASTMMSTKNSISMKRLIDKKFADPEVPSDLKSLPFAIIEGPDGFLLIHVRYLVEVRAYTTTQVFAMMLSNFKEIAQKYLNAAVVDCWEFQFILLIFRHELYWMQPELQVCTRFT